jgi:outer membrane receptor protein involved in Fe transport
VNFAGDPNSPSVLSFQDLIWGAQGSVAETTENQFFTANGTRRGTDLTRFRQHEWDLFAQDTWKVSPRFTAILGLRYAFNGVPYEENGNFSNSCRPCPQWCQRGSVEALGIHPEGLPTEKPLCGKQSGRADSSSGLKTATTSLSCGTDLRYAFPQSIVDLKRKCHPCIMA